MDESCLALLCICSTPFTLSIKVMHFLPTPAAEHTLATVTAKAGGTLTVAAVTVVPMLLFIAGLAGRIYYLHVGASARKGMRAAVRVRVAVCWQCAGQAPNA